MTREHMRLLLIRLPMECRFRDDRVERVTSSDEGFNRGNLCVNGRFGYAAFNSSGRLTVPLLGAARQSAEGRWDQALGTVAARLKDIVSGGGYEGAAPAWQRRG